MEYEPKLWHNHLMIEYIYILFVIKEETIAISKFIYLFPIFVEFLLINWWENL
jgi:hypothetical protein